MSDRDPALTVPYMAMVNVSRSARLPDDWQPARIEPTTRAEERHPPFARALLFGVPLSGLFWVALYGLWRLCAG